MAFTYAHYWALGKARANDENLMSTRTSTSIKMKAFTGMKM